MELRQPRDGCPYKRPFSRDFSDCPAYHPRPFIALNVNYQVLPPVWTCRHLDAKRSEDPPHGYYAHCAVGGYPDRVKLAEAIGRERFERLRELERRVIDFELPYLFQIESCKARELMPDYMSEKPREGDSRAEMDRIKSQLLDDLRPFLEERSGDLSAIGATVDDSIEVTRVWLDYLISRPSLVLEGWDLPQDHLERVPEELRGLLSPSEPAG